MSRPKVAGSEHGQAAVEYAAVCAVLIVIAVAIGALWRFGAGGGFQEIAQSHASHALESDGGMLDVLLY